MLNYNFHGDKDVMSMSHARIRHGIGIPEPEAQRIFFCSTVHAVLVQYMYSLESSLVASTV